MLHYKFTPITMLNIPNLVIKIYDNIFISVALKPNSGVDRLVVEVSTHITDRQTDRPTLPLPLPLLLTSDQLVAQADTYITNNTTGGLRSSEQLHSV